MLLAVVAMPEPSAEVLGHLPEQQGYPVGGHHSLVPLNPPTPVLGLVAGALIKGIELWLPGAPTFRGVTLDLCHVDLCHRSWWGQPYAGLLPAQLLVSSRWWEEPWVAAWRQLYGAWLIVSLCLSGPEGGLRL